MRGRGQAGQATVELAVVISLLLILALGLLDFARVFYTYVGLTNVAREGARCATLKATLTNTSCDNVPTCLAATVKAWMIDAAHREQVSIEQFSLTTDMIKTNCSDEATSECVRDGEVLGQGDRRNICITYPFAPATPFVAQWLGDGSNITLRTWATLPVMVQ